MKLPSIFADHMVLQAGAKLPVWGKADPGETVVVNLAGQQRRVTADQHGRWRVVFDPITSDSPLQMQLSSSASDKTITIQDILIGEVWICSGQSNMDWPVRAALEPAREIAEADYPQIRLFIVENRASSQPQEDLVGQWRICSPKTVGDFSAVGYFFGRKLHRHLKTPMGLIESAWGGTACEAWTDIDSLKAEPVLEPIVQRYEQSLPRAAELRAEYEKKLAEWIELATHKDPGDSKTSAGWAGVEFDDSGWKSIDLPGSFESCTGQDIDGAVWYRRVVNVPESWAGRELELNIGVVDDHDVAYFNGVRVGSTGPDTPRAWQVARRYIVPAE
ncbi:MAG TPA: sialate O-acetylesterase, partial [Tepidisphaeraceae bacterium]|nr:sialate O-acetylesterase [Tepidisphaeraceae bacterium]